MLLGLLQTGVLTAARTGGVERVPALGRLRTRVGQRGREEGGVRDAAGEDARLVQGVAEGQCPLDGITPWSV